MGSYITRTLIAACGFALMLVAQSTPSHAACVVGVAGLSDNYLSLRTGPGSRYREIRRMPNETEFRILQRSGNWRKVRLYDGTVGWAHSSYIGTCGDGHGGGHGGGGAVYHVTGLDPYGDNYLSVRSGPATRFRELRRIGLLTVVTVHGRRGAWRRVHLRGGVRGWVHGRYLTPGHP
ncbi:MAG: SH3 domain-containing protein [Pseudomonadota bacterium]